MEDSLLKRQTKKGNKMTQKDLEFLEANKKFNALEEKFKFWNGFSFGAVVAMFLTIGDAKRYFIALACWLVGTIFSGVYLHKASKTLKDMEDLI